MAVALRIIRLTQRIDEGDYDAYLQLKALAKTDPDARRVLKTVREPAKPASRTVKVAPQPKVDTPKQVEEKAKGGDQAAIAQLRKRAEYEDSAAQSALGIALMKTDAEEARKWLIRSWKVQESMDALRRMAASGDAKAAAFVEEHTGDTPSPRARRMADRASSAWRWTSSTSSFSRRMFSSASSAAMRRFRAEICSSSCLKKPSGRSRS